MKAFYYRAIAVFFAVWLIIASACAPPRRPHRPKPPKRPFTQHHFIPAESGGAEQMATAEFRSMYRLADS